MYRTLIAAVALAAAGGTAYAQDAQAGNHNPAVKDSTPHTVGMPAKGHNSFTKDQAMKRLAKAGYAVSSLAKDADGAWTGMATKDGKSVTVALDYKGNVTAK